MGILPLAVRVELERGERRGLEEIRLRRGRKVQLVFAEYTRLLDCVVGEEELEYTLRVASRVSIHTVLPQLRQGFLTLSGGHRLGVCGTVCLREGEIHSISPLSGLNIRLARAVPGIGRTVVQRLCPKGAFASTLILAPPGAGKTTLLRDVIRCLSDGVGCQHHRVGLVDERGEVAALCRGMPQLDVGENTDVMDGCPKARGLIMLLRGMNPQVLAADEITAEEDVQAVRLAAGCGVGLLCTAHGSDREDLCRRPLYRGLMAEGIFHNLLTIWVENGQRRYEMEEL